MAVGDDGFESRAAARRGWPMRLYELGAEPSDDLSATTTVEERIAMMWPLAVDAWVASGQAWPDYTRSEMPGRILRSTSDEPVAQ